MAGYSTHEERAATEPEYFAAQYFRSDDPWNFAGSEYEQEKYRQTMAMLPRRHYQNAFEPGCSIGVLSEMLAQRCSRLLSWDTEPRAVASARRRLAGYPWARAQARTVPGDWPGDRFDLVVVSELAYYFTAPGRRALWTAVAGSTIAGATVAAVHWRGHSGDHACHGDLVHEELRADPRFRLLTAYLARDYRCEVFLRDPRAMR